MVRRWRRRHGSRPSRAGWTWSRQDGGPPVHDQDAVRSRQHRTLLALYLGLGLAVVVSSILPLALQRGMAAFARPGVSILAAPLVLMFVALVGMRVAFAIPVDIKANWVIRLREPGEIVAAMDGSFTAMLAWAVSPFVLLGGISAGTLWGFGAGAKHAIVTALMGWFLAEVLVLRLCKIPFTCTYLPGRSEIKTLWPLYFTAFTTFTYSMAGLEVELLRWTRGFAWFIVLVSCAAVIARVARRRWLAEQPGLRFAEEEPGALRASTSVRGWQRASDVFGLIPDP